MVRPLRLDRTTRRPEPPDERPDPRGPPRRRFAGLLRARADGRRGDGPGRAAPGGVRRLLPGRGRPAGRRALEPPEGQAPRGPSRRRSTARTRPRCRACTSPRRSPRGRGSADVGRPRDATRSRTEVPAGLVDHPRYRVESVLGAGGMGTVFLAEHRLMERPVALKVIRPDLVQARRWSSGSAARSRAAARLAHPNIVTAYDAEQAGGHAHAGHGVRRGDRPGPVTSASAARCPRPRRASTPGRRRWGSSTPTSTGWSTATSSRRT